MITKPFVTAESKSGFITDYSVNYSGGRLNENIRNRQFGNDFR